MTIARPRDRDGPMPSASLELGVRGQTTTTETVARPTRRKSNCSTRVSRVTVNEGACLREPWCRVGIVAVDTGRVRKVHWSRKSCEYLLTQMTLTQGQMRASQRGTKRGEHRLHGCQAAMSVPVHRTPILTLPGTCEGYHRSVYISMLLLLLTSIARDSSR